MTAVLALALLAAAPVPAPTPPARDVVLLRPADLAENLAPFERALAAQLADLPVAFRAQPVPKLEAGLSSQLRAAVESGGPSALAVVWMEVAPGAPVFLFVCEPRDNRVFARAVEWDAGAGHVEAVAIIVRSSVQALLSGEALGFEPVTPGGKTGVGRPVRLAEPGSFHLALRAGYTPSLISNDASLLHGVDASIVAGWGPRFFGSLGYTYFTPVIRRAGTYSLAVLTRHPATLAGGAKFDLDPFEVEAEASLTFDWVGIETRDLGPWFSVAPFQTDFSLLWGATVRASFPLFQRMRIVAGLGADFPTSASQWTIKGPAGDGVVLDTHPAQPRAFLGLRWDILD